MALTGTFSVCLSTLFIGQGMCPLELDQEQSSFGIKKSLSLQEQLRFCFPYYCTIKADVILVTIFIELQLVVNSYQL